MNYIQVSLSLSLSLSQEFAKTDWGDYCLAHLFTAEPFTDSSRLGVAYTAFFNSLRAGGVCSRRESCALNIEHVHVCVYVERSILFCFWKYS